MMSQDNCYKANNELSKQWKEENSMETGVYSRK